MKRTTKKDFFLLLLQNTFTKKDFFLLLLQNTFTKKEKVPHYEVPLLILKYL
ncbi:hypothetical protein H175_ch3877 [Bacillus thuringiensis serovar thuringiensis str. IS5056]|nr:hypothetical protein CT43_CH3816 [Bacillus thuringiensis serovar chinensis CT-43]AGG02589.1 hypothetical protein H175_ch3877 [Bacillus thuringiensis serovar thuringiensis str. IS5056]